MMAIKVTKLDQLFDPRFGRLAGVMTLCGSERLEMAKWLANRFGNNGMTTRYLDLTGKAESIDGVDTTRVYDLDTCYDRTFDQPGLVIIDGLDVAKAPPSMDGMIAGKAHFINRWMERVSKRDDIHVVVLSTGTVNPDGWPMIPFGSGLIVECQPGAYTVHKSTNFELVGNTITLGRE